MITATALAMAALAMAALATAAVATAMPASPAPNDALSDELAPRYVNPVSRGFADTFADPSVVRGRDGYWYAYGTADPLREGQARRVLIPIARSRDLVSWSFVGAVFTASNRPRWASRTSSFWAPDIRYFDGSYRLYYVVTDTTLNPSRFDRAIGVATAPTPTGPWTDSGAPVVAPRGSPGARLLWALDPAQFTDRDGTRYLYYGSYAGGVWVTRLSRDGTRAVGSPVRVAISTRYEAPSVVRRGGYYYLFASSGDCCTGPTAGYSVFVGRARSVRGPFRDREGVSLNTSRVGGTVVLTPNGNRWIGTGHSTVVTDLGGQTWLAYHAIDRADPFLNEPFGVNQRPMLLDRLDWSDGWPTVRAGRWASERPVSAPATAPSVGGGFEAVTSLTDWRQTGGPWALVRERRAGFVRRSSAGCAPSRLMSRAVAPAAVRVEAELRQQRATVGATGVLAAWRGEGDHLGAWLDAERRALVVEAFVAGRRVLDRQAPLPSGFDVTDWHHVSLERRGPDVVVSVADARLSDPLAQLRVHVPAIAHRGGAIGVAGRCARSDADEVMGTPLFRPTPVRAPSPRRGVVDQRFSDEFSGGTLDREWRWVRAPDGDVRKGQLVWPTQAGDLVGAENKASVLLRFAPTGPYTVESRLSLDLGERGVRNFQQAGLIVYVGDDLFARLSHVAIGPTRQVEYGKEARFAGRTTYGQIRLGPPRPRLWLRIIHRAAPNGGEHAFQAWMSRDGRHWQPGGVWTIPAGTNPQIGLISHGAAPGQQKAIARFDYFRVHRP